ncbi:MAG: hypothetical protein Q8R15_04220, partial [Candidatus Micrarchaeota archaeon]|nr:hypothetical protein [Candidatus Micrarchaeota archaeon]
MGIRADLLKFYFEVEARYYSFCDWLEKQSVPVYEYFITPVENAGWPSFPVAFGLLLVLIAAVAFSLSSLSIVPSGENAVYIVVLGNNHEPVEGALVELVATGNLVVASGATNATGEVYFADRQNALQVKITHSDFETLMRALRPSLNLQLTSKTISQLNSEPPSRGNEQLGFIGDFSNLVQISQFGSFEVSLASGEVLLNGTMRVFDADTDTMLREAQVVGGVAVFENLPLNQHVYFHGISRGFTVNRTLDFIVSRNSQTVEIQATPVQEANATISVVSSLTRQPLQGAEVKLYREDNVFMYNGSTSSRGNVSFEMSTDVRYYVTVKKQNFLTAVSTFFVPVQGVTVELTPADVNSSSTLRVFFQDEYSEPLQGIATLYTSDNQIIEQSRVSQTVQDFRNLQRGLSVVVKGTSGELTSRKNVTLLEAVHEEVLQMEVRFAFLSLSAVDALTRATIVSDVNVTVMRDGSLLSTCTAPCVARVKTRGVYFINFSSIGYFNYVVQYGLRGQSLQTFQEATTTEVNASMMPVESVRDSQILLNGVFDAFTFQPITAGNALVQNRVYLASVSTYFANATIGGTFFTVSSGNNFGSILSFTPYPDEDDAPIGLDVRGSNDPDGRQCGSALNGERWKRVVLQQPLNPTSLTGQHYQFFFVPEVGQYSNITLSYKSFVNNTNRAVIRNPFDSNLGTNAVQYNGANSECSAQTYKTSFAVISPNEASNQLGSIKLNLRQTRNFSLVERVNAIESCGAITGTGTQQSDYASFDCNGFTVDSGQPNPLEVNALIRLNYAARGGKIRFTANQDYFALVNSSFNVSNRPPQVFHDGESPVFEQVIPSELFGVQGSREIYATVKLTAVGFTSSTEINAEFVPSEADALMLNSSNNTLAKSLFVTVNQLTIPRSVSLLSRFSCGNQTSVNFSYDDGLLPSGSGWIGCNQIPMIVDPVFPADAIPIYVENATSSRDCAAPGSGGALVSKAKLELGVESRPSPNGQPCFDLLDESDSRLAGGVLKHVEGYDGYVLRFNSVACGGVHGNDVSLSNVTLKLSCEGRATATGPIDTKTVNVTVFKQGGEWLKNLVAARFKTTTTLNSFSNNSRVTYFYAPSNGTCPFGWPVIARINLNHPTNFTIEEINGRSTSIWGIAENKIGLTGYFQANARIFVNNASAISNQAANYRAGQILPRAIDLFDRDSDYSYLLRKKIPRYLPLPSSTVPSVGVGAFYCAVHTDQPLQPIYGMDNEDNYAFAFIEKAPQPIELNPELYVLIDNLQIRTPENR